MKKIIFYSVAIIAISFTSCKKDQTCECSGEGNGVTTSASSTAKLTNKKAKEWCEEKGGTVNGVTTKCELK